MATKCNYYSVYTGWDRKGINHSKNGKWFKPKRERCTPKIKHVLIIVPNKFLSQDQTWGPILARMILSPPLALGQSCEWE